MVELYKRQTVFPQSAKAFIAVGIELNKYQSICQYGTAENGTNPHAAWQRDGVAPQCSIPGLDWGQSPYGRVKFQGKADFVNSHLSGNYVWVISNIKLGENGYVKGR